jgi:environmental stress-induced protein Ves
MQPKGDGFLQRNDVHRQDISMSNFVLLPARERIAQSWKNGGGTMWDIAIFPQGATTETFGWRLSIAEISASRAFSQFPGVARHFALLSGEGVTLAIKGRAPASVTPAAPAISFSGDDDTEATLHDGRVLALNLMTRRGFSGSLSRIGPEPTSFTASDPRAEYFVIAGASGLNFQMGTDRFELGPQDALRFGSTLLPDLKSATASHWLARLEPR